jgi:stage II sporulation protein AA (anti-sigma F factor antagonist)
MVWVLFFKKEVKILVKIDVTGEVVTAFLSGEIDHHTAAKIRKEIDAAVESNILTLLVLDFGGVTFMDSSGIGLVMGRYATAKKKGAVLHVCSVNEQLFKVMRLAGIERLARLEKGEM